MPDPDEKTADETLTKEEQEELAHQKSVDEDPDGEPLPEKEEESPEKEPAKEPEAKEEEKDSFDPEILSIAADLGVDEATARAYSTVADLERHLYGLSSRAETKPDEKEPEKEKAPEKVQIQAGDDLDDTLVKQLNDALGELGGRNDKRVEALEGTIATLQATIQQNQLVQFVSQFDALIEKHGKGYEDVLGKGSTFELEGTSKERGNREKLFGEMGAIVAGYQSINRRIPGDEQLIKRALREAHGERSSKEDGVDKTEARQSQFLRRGSSKAPTPPSKRQRARMELREKLAASFSGEEEELLQKTGT